MNTGCSIRGNHIFPIRKYRLIYERLLAMGAKKENFLKPEPASEEDILRVHSAKYLRKLKTGTLSSAETQALELPYSQALVKFAILTVGRDGPHGLGSLDGRPGGPYRRRVPSCLSRSRGGILRPE